MSRPANREPTDGELEILRVLWQRGPAELGVVCSDLRQRREVATTTVATMLKVMLDKGLVKRAGGPRGYLWSARATRVAVQRRLLRKLISTAFDGSARGLVEHMLADGNLGVDDWQELRALWHEAQREDGGDDD